jgi:hypothetical protein
MKPLVSCEAQDSSKNHSKSALLTKKIIQLQPSKSFFILQPDGARNKPEENHWPSSNQGGTPFFRGRNGFRFSNMTPVKF